MENLSNIAMPIIIGVISFSIGFSLHFRNFRRVATHPAPIITGLVTQIIFLPTLGFAIALLWPMDPIFKMGLILISACPGGTMSNFITFLLKGRVALSVSLTAFNSIIILFSIPFILQLASIIFMGESSSIQLSFGNSVGEILFKVILPTLAGLCINELLPQHISEKIKGSLKYIIWFLLAASVALVIFGKKGTGPADLLEHLPLIFPLLLLNILSIYLGYYASGHSYLKLNAESRFTIAIEVGLQNSVLAIFIASELLQKPEMALMPALYGGFSLFTTWGLAWYFKTRAQKSAH